MQYHLKPLNDPTRHTAAAMHEEAASDARLARLTLKVYGPDHPIAQMAASAAAYKAKLAKFYAGR